MQTSLCKPQLAFRSAGRRSARLHGASSLSALHHPLRIGGFSAFPPMRGAATGAAAVSRSTEPMAAAAESAKANVAERPFSAIPSGGSIQDFAARLQKYGPYGMTTSYYEELGHIMKLDMMGSEEVWIFDPVESMKVFLNEGRMPTGLAGDLWFFNAYAKQRGCRPSAISQLQKDLFTRQAAESYLPAVNQAVRELMPYIPKTRSLKDMTIHMVTDLFFVSMLGHKSRVTSHLAGESVAAPADVEFLGNLLEALKNITLLILDPTAKDNLTDLRFVAFGASFDKVLARSRELINVAKAKAEQTLVSIRADGEFPSHLKDIPFLVRVLARNEITEEEAVSELAALLGAGVDTTATVLLWFLLNLALHPDKQAILRQELLQMLGPDGDVTEQNIHELTYLNCCMRESHRLTPSSFVTTIRTVPWAINLCGYNIPAGTRIVISTGPVQMDRKLVERPEQFIPERFLPAEVAKRKGTPSEVLDHVLAKRPFSFGARMCIGARLAEVEMLSAVAHLVRQFSFRLDPPDQQFVPVPVGNIRPQPCPSVVFAHAPR